MELGSNNFWGISSTVTYFASLVIYVVCQLQLFLAQISWLLLTVVISKWYIRPCCTIIGFPTLNVTQIARKFSCDIPWGNSSQKFLYYPTLKGFFTFYTSNRNIEKASDPHFLNPSSPEWYNAVNLDVCGNTKACNSV